ncbi:MAG: glutamate--tRNA ligase [bacterium]
MSVRVRMAPSPTGFFHVGSARTALFNYLFAKHNNGTFILRIEDTDQERSKLEHEALIYKAFAYLGIDYDEGPEKPAQYGPYRQSERIGFYPKYAQQLLDAGNAYYCFCSPQDLTLEREEQARNKVAPRYSGKCRNLTKKQQEVLRKEGRKPALRFAIPDVEVVYSDMIRGEVRFDASLFGDMVIMKADGFPAYNFACVVDDALMEISHVIRGEDHISNTPKQILLYDALGFSLPDFAHLPLILNPDRSKMSKRKGDCNLFDYQQAGYMSEAFVNFLALVGWSPGNDKELFTKTELVQLFSLLQVGKSGAIFNRDKVDWFNGMYIRQLSLDELLRRCTQYIPEQWQQDKEKLKNILKLVQERLVVFSEVKEQISFVFESIIPDKLLLQPAKKTAEEAILALGSVNELFASVSWDHGSLEQAFREKAIELEWKTGELFMLVRIAVTGSKASPPLFDTLLVLGKECVIERVERAIVLLSS